MIARAVLVAAVFAQITTTALAAERPVTFPSRDGTPLAATLYEPSVRPAPAVVLVHMLGRSKEDWASIANLLSDVGVIALAIDLRGHGRSAGSTAPLAAMADDVRAAVSWLTSRPGVRPDPVAVVGASLGASLAVMAASDFPFVRAVALISPSLDYRGLRLDSAAMKRLGDRPVWLAASTKDPYALRTLRDLVAGGGRREQRLSDAAAHGTNLLAADADLARGLVDWLRNQLIF
jgi:alpha-beta hydrolase superfamily lysophospholipase